MQHNILCIFLFTGSSSEEESGEEEESGSGTEQDGSGDTASEPGSQHTTPDNVSGEEIEHGEIVSSGDKHVERIEEGEEDSGDDEDTKNGESLEGSLSGQDRRSNNAERRSRHKKKHKQKTRFVKSIFKHFTILHNDDKFERQGQFMYFHFIFGCVMSVASLIEWITNRYMLPIKSMGRSERRTTHIL